MSSFARPLRRRAHSRTGGRTATVTAMASLLILRLVTMIGPLVKPPGRGSRPPPQPAHRYFQRDSRPGQSAAGRRHPPDRSEGRRCGRGGHGHGRTAPHRHHRHRRQRSPAERRAEHRVLRHDASSAALPGREAGRNRAWDARPDRGRGSPVSPSVMPGTGPRRPCPVSPAPRSGSSSPPSSPSGRGSPRDRTSGSSTRSSGSSGARPSLLCRAGPTWVNRVAGSSRRGRRGSLAP